MYFKELSRYLLFSAIVTNLVIIAETPHAVKKGISTVVPQSVKKERKSVNESKKALVAKIGIVDIRRIITQNPAALEQASHEWKDLFMKLQEVLKEPQREIAELEERYKKRIAELESLQKTGISSKEALMRKYQEEVAPLEYQLQAQDQQLQRFSYDELAKAQSIVGPKIDKAIDRIAAEQGWDFVIIRDSVLSKSYSKDFEITDEVLELLNKEYAGEKGKATSEKRI